MGLLDRCVENIQPVNSEDLDIDEVIKVLTLNEHEKRTLTNLSLIYDSAVKMLEELKEFRSLGIIPEQMREISEMYRELATELGKYKKAEEQGLLLKLPCKVGDTIYRVSPHEVYIDSCQITGFTECDSIKSMCYTVYIEPDEEDIIDLSDFGKTVFLTQEEAEKALA